MPSETTVPPIILDLVARFAEHRDSYHHGDYNETQLRRDYLDPFFEALGWDVNNRQGYAEAFREVVHERSLRVEQSAKAPDYGFRIGGVRKFFVEAKKPSVDIDRDTAPAFQLRRYAWTASLPLSILSNFEQFAVYDCRVKPDKLPGSIRNFVSHVRGCRCARPPAMRCHPFRDECGNVGQNRASPLAKAMTPLQSVRTSAPFWLWPSGYAVPTCPTAGAETTNREAKRLLWDSLCTTRSRRRFVPAPKLGNWSSG